ncbi:uncharacterized protein LAESUDRAFT_712482 [Laetiporus sulphureus 93-53]|uniref:Uncharacterized protein n=1 Tax=Laetiporus sulphureus 93-53 TaxID=1314785 RepID=A0A165FEH2_9APHY|nr:uncharacterized protein LAESUDRAFT_712482 [Laetiporus sulphureus 93-53]KZT08848.1 hypothetical protein LAESUDRAFT_712482 [Laetiporus sulphureus 93-53]
MLFLEEIATPDEMEHNEQSPDQHYNAGDDQITDEEDEHAPPVTPQALRLSAESERERERRRLERIVLKVLDLGFDYRQEVLQAASVQAALKAQSWWKHTEQITHVAREVLHEFL